MPIIDEIREQQKKVKQQGFKSQIRYFWDYYRVHTIIAIIAIVILYLFLSDFRKGQRDCIVYAMMLNGYPETDTEQLMEDFLTENDYDSRKVSAFMETNFSFTPGSLDASTVAVVQKMLAMTQSGTIDILIADTVSMEYFAEQTVLRDLREVLPAVMLDYYEANGYLIFYQADVSSEPFPIGIHLEAFPKLTETHAYDAQTDTPVVCIISSSPRTDNIVQFLNFLGK